MLTATIKEIKEMNAGQYADIEVYKPLGIGEHYPWHFHTDNCNYTEEYTDDSVCGMWELMDEDKYHDTIEANNGIETSFADVYGDAAAQVLCVMLID